MPVSPKMPAHSPVRPNVQFNPRSNGIHGAVRVTLNQSPFSADQQVLSDEKVTPFVKRGVSFLLKPNSAVDVPFEIEVIVH